MSFDRAFETVLRTQDGYRSLTHIDDVDFNKKRPKRHREHGKKVRAYLAAGALCGVVFLQHDNLESCLTGKGCWSGTKVATPPEKVASNIVFLSRNKKVQVSNLANLSIDTATRSVKDPRTKKALKAKNFIFSGTKDKHNAIVQPLHISVGIKIDFPDTKKLKEVDPEANPKVINPGMYFAFAVKKARIDKNSKLQESRLAGNLMIEACKKDLIETTNEAIEHAGAWLPEPEAAWLANGENAYDMGPANDPKRADVSLHFHNPVTDKDEFLSCS